MAMTDLFLKRTALAQIDLLRTIQRTTKWQVPVAEQVAQARERADRTTDVNLKYLAQVTNESYSTVYNTYNRMMTNLATIGGEAATDKLLQTPDGQLRVLLVQQSLAYQFLQHLVAEDMPNFDDFLTQAAVSKVTALRYLRPLRDFGKQMGVKISYEKMQLTGSEQAIRLFLTLSYWLATDGAAWPFTVVKHADAAAEATRVLKAYRLDMHNPVTLELFHYFTAISQTRLAQQHLAPAPVLELSAVPNLYATNTELSVWQQANESQQMLEIFLILPLAVGPNDPTVAEIDNGLARFSPVMRQLVDRFLEATPSYRRSPFRRLLQVSLAAIAMSVVNLGFDLGALLAQFNPHIGGACAHDADRPEIEAALTQAMARTKNQADAPLNRRLKEMAPLLVDRFHATLFQLSRFAKPARRVKVGLLLEPAMLGFADLLTFMNQQTNVELVYDHFEEADLIIQDSSLPLHFPGKHQPLLFRWDIAASGDLFGELAALLRTLQQEFNQ